MRQMLKLAVLGTGALMWAGGIAEAQRRSMYTSEERILISKAPLPEPSRVTYLNVDGRDTTIVIPPVEPAPAFRLVDYLDLNEPMLTGYMGVRDTFQLRMAAVAQAKAVDPRVRDLAAMIERDRIERLAENNDNITDEGVGTEPLARDPELARLQELTQIFDAAQSSPDFDAAYLRAQFFLHQNEIDVLTANLKNAHDNDLEDTIEESIDSLTNTRETIRTLSQALGVSLP